MCSTLRLWKICLRRFFSQPEKTDINLEFWDALEFRGGVEQDSLLACPASGHSSPNVLLLGHLPTGRWHQGREACRLPDIWARNSGGPFIQTTEAKCQIWNPQIMRIDCILFGFVCLLFSKSSWEKLIVGNTERGKVKFLALLIVLVQSSPLI